MEKILGQLRKIVNKEEKMGLTNAAVFGGFANYFISALEQILPQISEPVIKEQLSEMQLLARRYQEETLAERAGTLKKMTLLLERINPQYLPPALSGKANSRPNFCFGYPCPVSKKCGAKTRCSLS